MHYLSKFQHDNNFATFFSRTFCYFCTLFSWTFCYYNTLFSRTFVFYQNNYLNLPQKQIDEKRGNTSTI
jgi:hypothetical protein